MPADVGAFRWRPMPGGLPADCRADANSAREVAADARPGPPMTAPYLAKLNGDQRRAVEHGGTALAEAGPLLIIAGAGSGKTDTLAHRVAHLLVNGIDPRRILLLTFSRRAAAEMARRAARLAAPRAAGPTAAAG